MNAKEYVQQNNQLMEPWAKEAKEWVNCDATFYADGVFDPNLWFAGNNTFRPLFILKEVNESTEEKDPIINFVGTGSEGKDPWDGDRMWGRIGALATAMFQMKETAGSIPEYYSVKTDMEVIQQSGETKRQEVLRRVALINLKKLAGGETTNSEKSQRTLDFSCHARRFADKLHHQIQLISPTVIICCSKDVANCFNIENQKVLDIPVVIGWHPQRASTENFYYKTLTEMKERQLL